MRRVASDVTTTGRINGFGSIFIDGVEYDTVHGADSCRRSTRHRGRPARRPRRNGRSAHSTPDGKKGTAKQVTLTSDVRGDVASVDVAASTFVVLGQTVKVTADTLFDENTQAQDLAGLKSGAKVRVSGFTSAAGEVLASRIDGVTAAAWTCRSPARSRTWTRPRSRSA